MSNSVVKYRPRSVSKSLVAVFVVFLFVPLTIAFVVGTFETMRSGEVMRSASILGKLLFFAGMCVAVFRPAGRIIFDQIAGTVTYAPSWSTPYLPQFVRHPAAEHPLHGLATAVVEANPKGNLYRLVLIYRDGSKRLLTDNFYYSEESHSQVARALNARIRDQNLGMGN